MHRAKACCDPVALRQTMKVKSRSKLFVSKASDINQLDVNSIKLLTITFKIDVS